MEEPELLFLVWRALASGPLASTARVLEEEASKHGLLPTRVDISGNVRPVSFTQHCSLQPHIPPDGLRRLLDKLLQLSKPNDSEGGIQVLSLTAPGKHGLLGHAEPPLPSWWRRPHAKASLPHQLLLRQTGVGRGRLGMPGTGPGSSATALLCGQMRHLTTARGHRLAVYCCTYDNTGRRIITGSDDCLVKIWTAETGALLRCCRGHDSEITDFAVSADNRLLASGDMAHVIRVWSLEEGTLGWPVSVLLGHTSIVSYLDFHPHLPDALLSCSTDGTCRIWNARDPGVPALVMRPSIALEDAAAAAAAEEQDEEAAAGAAAMGAAAAGAGVGATGVGMGLDDEQRGNSLATHGGGPGSSRAVATAAVAEAAAAAAVGAAATAAAGAAAGAPPGAARGGGAWGAPAGAAAGTGAGATTAPAAAAAGAAAATGAATGRVARGASAGPGPPAPALGSPPAGQGPPTQQQQPQRQQRQQPARAAANRQQLGFLCCSWSPDGAFVFAGGVDCTVCVWHWNLTLPPAPAPTLVPALATAPAADQSTGLEGPTAMSDDAREGASAPRPGHTNIQIQRHVQHLQRQHALGQQGPPQAPAAAAAAGDGGGGGNGGIALDAGNAPAPAASGGTAAGGGEGTAGGGGVAANGAAAGLGLEAASCLQRATQQGPAGARRAAAGSAAAAVKAEDDANTAGGPAPIGSAVPAAGAGVAGSAPFGARDGTASAAAAAAGGDGAVGAVAALVNSAAGTTLSLSGGGGGVSEALAAAWEGRDWPQPTELARLCGHRNEIVFIEFSHEGHSVATASRDGCVKIWRRERDRRRGRLQNKWREALSLSCPPTEEEIRKARLKRKPPPHPAINQVAWNLDDTRMVAAVTDNTIRVWETQSGQPTHTLLEHTAQAHVLEAHPQDPRLVMSGGYDGRTILWDVVAGTALKMFSTQDTFPGRGRWTDPLQLVDGHFSPDGAQLAVTDTAGQMHMYGVPVAAAAEAMARAPYDQFLSSDYNGLVRDVNGWVLDELTQQPPHLMATGQCLCDYTGHPHPIEVQAAYAARRLADLPRPHAVDKDHPLPPALVTHPPTLISASWLAIENGSSAAAVQLAMNRAYERHMQALEALTRADDDHRAARGNRRSFGARTAAAAAGTGSRPGSEPPRRPLYGAAAASAAAAAGNIPRGVYMVVDDPTVPPPPPPRRGPYGYVSSDDDGGAASEPSSDHDGGDVDFEEVISISDGDGDEGSSGTTSVDDDASQDEADAAAAAAAADRSGRGRRRSRSRARETAGSRRAGGGGGGGASQGEGPTLRRSSRRDRGEATTEQEQQERIRRSARLSGHKRRYGDGEDGAESYDSDDSVYEDQSDGGEYVGSEVEEEDEADLDDDSGEDAEARRRQRRAAARRQREQERRAARRAQRERRNQQRREQRREERRRREQRQAAVGAGAAAAAAAAMGAGGGRDVEDQKEEEEEDALVGPPAAAAAAAAGLQQVARRRSHEAGGSRARPLEAYGWLQSTSYLPDYYCPQLGDEVVYVRAGHEAFLESVSDKRTPRPWLQLPAMRPSEPCTITELTFEILRDGLYHTAANLRLTVNARCDSPIAGCTFAVQLPPPLSYPDQPAFLVPLPRFNTAVARRWQIGERCKTYQMQLTDGEAQGCWHTAVVVEDKLHPNLGASLGPHLPLPNPHACDLWERYGVRWDGDEEITYLSPWDMLPQTASWDDVVRYARATAAAKADEIVAQAAAKAAAASAAGPSTSSAAASAAGTDAAIAAASRAAELSLDLGGGWAEEQATAARLALERLYAEEGGRRYSVFLHCPPPTATFPCADGDGRPVPYNAIVPLPLSLELIEARLESSFYRSLAAVSHDIGTIVANAERFNGAESPPAARAREMRLRFTAWLSGNSLEDLALYGPDVIVRRSRRRMAAPRRGRRDLSRLWELVTLDLETAEGVAGAAGAQAEAPEEAAEEAGRGGGSGAVVPVRIGAAWRGAGAVRGGTEEAGGFSGPRRRGGPLPPPPPPPSRPLTAAAPASGPGAAAAAPEAAPGHPTVGTWGGAGPGQAPVPWPEVGAPGPGRGGAGHGGEGGRAQRPGLGPRRGVSGAPVHAIPYSQPQELLRQEGDTAVQAYGQQRPRPPRQQPPPPPRRQQQQQRQALNQSERPRRDRGQVQGRYAMLLKGGDDDEEEEEEEVDEEDDDDSDAAPPDADSDDSDSDGRGGSRRRRQARQGGGPTHLRRQTRQAATAQRRQQQPLRRSARARQCTKYGSDWEDEVASEDIDEGSEEDDGEEAAPPPPRRPPSLTRAAPASGGTAPAPAPAVAATAAAAAAVQPMRALMSAAAPPEAPMATQPLGFAWPSAAQAFASASLPPDAVGVVAGAEDSMTAAAAAAGLPPLLQSDAVAAAASQAGAANRKGGRLRIRLRGGNPGDAGPPPPPQPLPLLLPLRSPPAAVAAQHFVQQLPSSPERLLPVRGPSGGGGGESATPGSAGAVRHAARRPARGAAAAAEAAAAAAVASPQQADRGRSRRAAAVRAVAAVAAAAAAANSEDSEDDEGDLLPASAPPAQRLARLRVRGGGTNAPADAGATDGGLYDSVALPLQQPGVSGAGLLAPAGGNSEQNADPDPWVGPRPSADSGAGGLSNGPPFSTTTTWHPLGYSPYYGIGPTTGVADRLMGSLYNMAPLDGAFFATRFQPPTTLPDLESQPLPYMGSAGAGAELPAAGPGAPMPAPAGHAGVRLGQRYEAATGVGGGGWQDPWTATGGGPQQPGWAGAPFGPHSQH